MDKNNPKVTPMKRFYTLLLGINLLICGSIIGPAILLSGCGTTPYKVVATSQVTVDAGMHLWGVYVTQNHPPVSQEVLVKSAYTKWQSAMALVCDAGKAYAAAQAANAPTTQALLAALDQAVADAATDRGDLLNLLTQFGVKLQ